ncbi:MAG: hypothetical protein AAFY65_01225 [Pseudomonadota bacterium]
MALSHEKLSPELWHVLGSNVRAIDDASYDSVHGYLTALDLDLSKRLDLFATGVMGFGFGQRADGRWYVRAHGRFSASQPRLRLALLDVLRGHMPAGVAA